MEQEKPKKKNKWSWKLDEFDLKKQVDGYQTLKISESYRGISVLIVLVLLGLSFVLSFFGLYSNPTTVFYGIMVYLPVLFFVYKGHRWAIIALMIMWTYEKGYEIYQVVQNGGSGVIMPIIWYLIFMPYFWKALQIENEKRKDASILSPPKDTLELVFCSKCGGRLEINSKFCSKCGSRVL